VTGPGESGLRRWSLALLFLAGTLNLFDRQIVNVLSQQIKVELALSDAKLGLLTGTAFGLLYSFAIIPLARLADRTNRVRLIASALLVWSVFTGLCGATVNFVQLFLARMGVGIGEAGCQPASVSLVADLFPEAKRTSATAILLVGAPTGACLGLLVGGYITASWGWRVALYSAAIPGIVVAALMFLTMKDPGVNGRPAREGSFTDAMALLARTVSLRWMTIAFGCETFCLFATGAWLPAFFMRAHAMSPLKVGKYLGVAVGIGGAVGALGIGFLSDMYRRRGRPRDWLLAKAILILNVPLIAFVVSVPNVPLAMLGVLLLYMTVYGYLGPVPVLIQRQAPIGTRALALGGTTAIANILSMCLGVPAVGLLSDALQPHFGAPAVGYALFIAICAVAVVGVFALTCAQRAEIDNADSVTRHNAAGNAEIA
jgi:MFS transporter, Spinster family, sphingosine-1-phosphate transporter